MGVHSTLALEGSSVSRLAELIVGEPISTPGFARMISDAGVCKVEYEILTWYGEDCIVIYGNVGLTNNSIKAHSIGNLRVCKNKI